MQPWQQGRRAVVDIGSNTIKILVAEIGPDGFPLVVGEQVRETRLSGAGTHLGPAAFAAGVSTVMDLVAWARSQGAERIAVVATAAVRQAGNQGAFVDAIRDATGVTARVLSGEEEALLIGLGLRQDPALRGLPQMLQLDLGGGSVEVIEHQASGLAQAVSLPLGAVRVTRECIPHPELPLGSDARKRVCAHARMVLAAASFRIPKAVPLAVLTGGGLVEAAVLLTGQPTAEFARSDLELLADDLAALPLAARIARGVSPGRADVIPAGIWVILSIVEAAGIGSLRTSVYNLRRGVLMAWALGTWEDA